jgi:hypothetical protein
MVAALLGDPEPAPSGDELAPAARQAIAQAARLHRAP